MLAHRFGVNKVLAGYLLAVPNWYHLGAERAPRVVESQGPAAYALA